MEATRGCALGRPSARDPSVRQIRVSRASDGASRARGVRSKGGTRAAAHGMGGEAAGHARAKANTRRVARGAGRGEGQKPENSVSSNVQQPGAVASV